MNYTSVDPRTQKEKIWGSIAPENYHSYPVFLNTNNRGGQRAVSGINTNTIPLSHQETGMIAYQTANSRHYRLTQSGTWEILAEPTSNGLYEYVRYPADGNGTVLEMYKWDNGRLEYYIQYALITTSSSRYELWEAKLPRCYFPQAFIDGTQIPMASAVTYSTGVGWADTARIGTTYVDQRLMATYSNSRILTHGVVTGRWL